MPLQVFISALVLGLISSFHCVGMCGPLALSLPLANQSTPGKIMGILLYNSGRVITYSLLGIFFGFVGRSLFIAGYQQLFSIGAGIIIFIAFLLMVFKKRVSRLRFADGLYSRIQLLVARFIQQNNPFAFLMTGMANGLLPCGMVYLAITGAAATGGIVSGGVFMAVFGLGTLPAMMLLAVAGFFISLQARSIFRRLTPYAFLLMSVLLILRGLNLGIPFLSPYFATGSQAIPCH